MIEAVSPESPHYGQVVALGNANSRTLGHLPFAAIKQAAAEGRVLAFVEGGEVKGYVLFGKRVRTGDISLTHLCVDRNERGRGVARASGRGHRRTQPPQGRNPTVVPQGLRSARHVATAGVPTTWREARPRS